MRSKGREYNVNSYPSTCASDARSCFGAPTKGSCTSCAEDLGKHEDWPRENAAEEKRLEDKR